MQRRTFLAGASAAAILAACSDGEESVDTTLAPETTAASTTTTTEATTTTAAAAPETTTTVPEVLRQPLTGAVVESVDELVARPALVVKIDNHPDSRSNHSGLAVADVVFEEIVEGVTRFAAVFHTGDSDPVGPIRSGREQDVDMLASLNLPLFAWSGGNPGVTRLIAESPFVDLNQTNSAIGDAYYRGPGSAPHDLYSSTEALYALTPSDHPGAPMQLLPYVEPGSAFVGREQVVDVDLLMRFTQVRWEWDPENGWARFQDGDRHVDSVHGEIFATNVVVMVAEYGRSSIDANSPFAQTLGSGAAYVFSDGQVTTGRWRREAPTDPIDLVDDAGEPIGLTPGSTWVEVADNTGDPAFVVAPGATAEAAPDETTPDSAAATTSDTATDSSDGTAAGTEASTPAGPSTPTIDLRDPESAPTDIVIRFPEISEADST
ncbi:DUF3048 domain-containing protein [Ilumatobacter sp.]|uniref:DUF3048 domain-containing protein n=1 Tax=Ilumatobacter sp. TaxID=1967498 RepID=UPI003B524B8D